MVWKSNFPRSVPVQHGHLRPPSELLPRFIVSYNVILKQTNFVAFIVCIRFSRISRLKDPICLGSNISGELCSGF